MKITNKTRKYSGGAAGFSARNIMMRNSKYRTAGKQKGNRSLPPMSPQGNRYVTEFEANPPDDIAKKCQTATSGTPLKDVCDYIVKAIKSKIPTPLPGDVGKKAFRGGRKTKRHRRRKTKRRRRGRSKTRRHRRR